MSSAPRRGLGRGFEVLIGGATPELAHLAVDEIHPNAKQPRKRFDGDAGSGLAESITDGMSGFLVEPGDPAALAAAIERAFHVAADPEAGAAMREAASAVAETHDVRRSAEASLAWYGTLRA